MTGNSPPFFVRFYEASEVADVVKEHQLEGDNPRRVRKEYVTYPTQNLYGTPPNLYSTPSTAVDVILSVVILDIVYKLRKTLWKYKYFTGDINKEIDAAIEKYDDHLEEVFKDVRVKWAPGEYVSAAEAGVNAEGSAGL